GSMAALVDGGGGPPAGRASPDSGSAGAAWWQGPRARSLLSSEYSLLVLLLLGVAVAGWPSFSALLPLAGGDTPVSFVPLVPLMGAIFLLRRFSYARITSHPRDGFVDSIVLLLLCGAVVVVLLLLPVVMSWDYWLTRLDMPGVVLLLTALVVAAWGLPGLAQLGPALLYLLLAWPLPYLVIYNHIIPPLTDVTALATRIVASHLPLLGLRANPQDAYTLLVPFQGHT